VVRATHATRERVLDFIEREFGRIWRFEAARALENDPPTMFHIEVAGEVHYPSRLEDYPPDPLRPPPVVR
jgi:hypothetical protein